MVKRRLSALVSRRYSELQAKRHAGSHHGSRRRWFRIHPACGTWRRAKMPYPGNGSEKSHDGERDAEHHKQDAKSHRGSLRIV
jgi:hypothetical protein